MEEVGRTETRLDGSRGTAFAWMFLLAVDAAALAALLAFGFAQAYPASGLAGWLDLERDTGVHYLDVYRGLGHGGLALGLLTASLIVRRATRRLPAPENDGAAAWVSLSRWALPTLGVWAFGSLILTFDSVRDVRGHSEDEYARLLAHALLDHPWPLIGAGTASIVFALLSLRTRFRLVRLLFASLACWALTQACLAGFYRLLARGFLVGGPSLEGLVRADRLLSLVNVGSRLLFVGAFVALGVAVLRRHPRTLASLTSAYLLALLCSVDASRLIGVRFLAAVDRLDRSLTNMQPLATSKRGQGVPELYAVLHSDLSLTLVNRDRIWQLPPDASLPPLEHRTGLALIVDQRCSVGALRALVERVPRGVAVSLARVSDLRDSRGASGAFTVGRLLALSVSQVPFLRPDERSLLLLWPDAKPQDISQLPADVSVGALASDQPLFVASESSALPTGAPPPRSESSPTRAWSLFGLLL